MTCMPRPHEFWQICKYEVMQDLNLCHQQYVPLVISVFGVLGAIEEPRLINRSRTVAPCDDLSHCGPCCSSWVES